MTHILLIPVGTQVVTRADLRDAAGTPLRQRGAVRPHWAAPSDASHAYRVRFGDGGEAAQRRSELKHPQGLSARWSAPGSAAR